jgi:hypothetical protein
MTVHRRTRPITKREATVLVTILVIAGGIAMLGSAWPHGFGLREIQCDGTVPAWIVPDEYDGTGCVELRPAWEGLLPENSDDSDYCLGLCANLAPYETAPPDDR